MRLLLLCVVASVSGIVTLAALGQPTARDAEPPAPAVEWVTREVTAPHVSFHTFDSAAAKTKVSYHLYTPAAYDAVVNKDRRFPVVYWLHGSGGGLGGIPQVARHFDAAIEAGKLPPCLVVFVNGMIGGFEGMYVDWKDGTAPLETVIVKDLVPHIDATFRTIATRDGRLLDGFSMGGYGAARLGFKFPEMFRAVSVVGAGPMQEELVQAPRAGRQRASEVLSKVYGGDQAYFRSVSPRTLAAQNARAIAAGSLVRVVIGDKDETFENNRLFHEHLEALKIPHTWTVLPGVAHDPMGVLRAMGDDNWAFYRTAFGDAKPPAASDAGLEIAPWPHGEDARAAGLNPAVLSRLDLAMQLAVANKEVAGIVGLVFRNGHRGYFEAFGKQDLEANGGEGTAMPKDALFRLMSMTKPVIAVAALTLLDDGRFTLDEPISKHLPEWANPMVLEDGKLVPARSPITPRMLMSHSSGLYYGQVDDGRGGRRSTASAALAFRASRGENITLMEYSEAVAKEPLKFHPGTGYNYGTSIDILGRYIEAVAGKPLNEVLRERLFAPLKMHDTAFWVPPEKASRIAQRYRQPQPGTLTPSPERDRPLTEKPTLFMGGHGLVSTVEDYERFCRMILKRGELDGVRILKPETVDLMFQNHLPESARMRYGLGGAVDERGGYSWGGANGTQFWIDRTNQMFAIFMVQTQGYRAPTYNTFRRLVNEAAGVASHGGGFDGPLGDQPAREDPGAGAPQPGGRLRQAFDRLDADGNGSLSKDEYAVSPMEGRTDFATADADGDGSVSYQEAMAVLRRR